MKAALLNNRYRIIKTLGRGGFGETYLTEDTHMPSGRQCVLKQLKPIVKQPKTPLWMKERFQREAAILEELGAGNSQIPRLYAYFSEDDKFYLVQEWIEGLTLNQYWEQEGNLHRDEVRKILLQLLPVLNYVHSRRIIHRDIKPENIILRKGDLMPILIDFGAVKEAMATEVNHNSNSMYSASIGTPGYMASEQAAGRPIYSSDLYSLGLTAIFLLTGKSPHELETDPSNGEIMWQEYAVNVDADLISVINRAVSFHPRDRFTTAQEMLAALQSSATASNTNATGATVNFAPPRTSNQTNYASNRQQRNHTVAVDVPYERKPKKSNWLVNAGVFLLIAMGVGMGTFAAGFAVVSNLWRSQSPSTRTATVEKPTRQPSIFAPTETTDEQDNQQPKDQSQASQSETDTESEQLKIETEKDTKPKIETEEDPKPEVVLDAKPEKILTRIEPKPESEINVPILTTGTSASQLVSTLGEPTSERRGWRENSRVLVYQDVVRDQVNLSYESDGTGKIRQTDIALNQSLGLGVMQDTLSKSLGGDAPAEVKDKLRSVYARQTNFSFFKVGNLEGKVQRDAKDRINISVWETGFQ